MNADVRQQLVEFNKTLWTLVHRDGHCDPGFMALAMETAAALSTSAEAPGREPTEIRKAIDALIRAAWEWGRICETDGVSFNGEGDGHVQWMKSDTMAAKVKLLQTLGIEPAPDAAPKSPSGAEPVPMLLYCPRCQMQHVDVADADWKNPPHATHTCKGCGLNWRPSNAPTVGVAAIPVAELGSEAKHIERMEATNPALYAAPSSSAEMRERAAKVCEDEAGKQGGLVALALDTVASRIRQLQEG